MRHQHGPRRPSHRPAKPAPVSSVPLADVFVEHEAWRKAQPGKPGRSALRAYWKPVDARHGPRPDYLLWRHLHAADCPPEKPQNLADLAAQALRLKEPALVPPVIALVAGWLLGGRAGDAGQRLRPVLREAVKRRDSELRSDSGAELVRLLADRALEESTPQVWRESWLALCQRLDPSWKPGRDLVLPSPAWVPVPPRIWTRWLVTAMSSAGGDATWARMVWRLQRSLRPEGALIRPEEWELLMQAACQARAEAKFPEAVRLTALALHLLPDRAPESLRQRAQVAAWFLAEAGVESPVTMRVNLDELPFPGDPPSSDKGREAARAFLDEADVSRSQLLAEMEADPDWQVLRSAGVVLHHPLAALAWIGRRAQSYALKKQHDLLKAAARLAMRHHGLGTLARIRAEFPESADELMNLARALRDSQRLMPVLRDRAAWQRCAECLRLAWGRLEEGAITDEEALFFLHETLFDRESTLAACLPENLRLLAAGHATAERRPSELIQALDADPRGMQSVEHQRAVELWSVAAELRGRESMAEEVWISLVFRGEAGGGRCSWIVQSSSGRRTGRGRLRSLEEQPVLIAELVEAARSVCPELRRLRVAANLSVGGWPPELEVASTPSWEAAFREMRSKDR